MKNERIKFSILILAKYLEHSKHDNLRMSIINI